MIRNKHSLRRLSALISCLSLVALAGCGAVSIGTDAESASTLRPTEEEKMAVRMVQAIFDQYAINGKSEDTDFVNLKEYHNAVQSGFLWSNFCGVGMQYYMCRLYPDDREQKEIFRKMINNFLFFRQSDSASNGAENSVKYHSARGTVMNLGSGDCFFDDNIWVARNYLRAYEILGDAWFLEEAIRVNNWVLSGWNEKLGGIVWSEAGLAPDADVQHLERGLSANACSIMVNAKLSQLAATSEESSFYLAWAERFYEFCKKMQNLPETYDYWNGIHTIYQDGAFQDGGINKVHYSYNSGSMILANLALFDCTEDAEKRAAYLDDAIKTAAAAYQTFHTYDVDSESSYYRGDPWFAAILNEAYYEMWQRGLESADQYMNSFAENVAFAYSNRDEGTGLCPYQAVWKVTWDKNESYVIHQTGFAEQAVLAALCSVSQKAASTSSN